MRLVEIHKRIWRFNFHLNIVDYYEETKLDRKIIPLIYISIYKPTEAIGLSLTAVNTMIGFGFYYGKKATQED